MPERVVDELEVVQVEHDHCAPAAVARLAHPMAVELALEAAAVQQSRQRVVVGQVHELLLRAPAVGDVLDLGDQLQRASIGVAQHGHLHRHPHRTPFSVNEAFLTPKAVRVAGKQRRDLLFLFAEVIRVGDRLRISRLELLARVARDLAQRVIDSREPEVQIEHRHSDRGLIEHPVEKLLRFAQSSVGPVALGHVAERPPMRR